MLEDLTCVILAGGASHRFGDSTSRFLQLIAGVPVINHVIDTVRSLGIKNIAVVSNVNEVEDAIESDVKFFFQPDVNNGVKGSGDALVKAKSVIESGKGDVLIVYGDRPMIKAKTLENLVAQGEKENAACAFLSMMKSKPHGHARVMRDENGMLMQTGRDCEIQTAAQQIREVVTGTYYFRKEALLEALHTLVPQNPIQFYLTDITTYLASRKQHVLIIPSTDPGEFEGIYGPSDLAAAEAALQSRAYAATTQHEELFLARYPSA